MAKSTSYIAMPAIHKKTPPGVDLSDLDRLFTFGTDVNFGSGNFHLPKKSAKNTAIFWMISSQQKRKKRIQILRRPNAGENFTQFD